VGNPLKPLLLALIPLLILQAPLPNIKIDDQKVLIRIDDIQDFNHSQEQQKILRHHLDNDIPAILGVIPTRFGYDDQLLALIREGVDRGILTVGLHGWKHESMANQSLSQQSLAIQHGKGLMEKLDIETRSLVPPLNEFDDNTLEAMKRNGLTLLSSASYLDDTPRLEDGILHLPSTVTTAEVNFATDSWILLPPDRIREQMGRSWNEYGISVVTIHPRQFFSPEGTWEDARWQVYLEFLDWVVEREGEFYRVDAPPPPLILNWGSLTASVALFAGITSTILIALQIDRRRKPIRQAEDVDRPR